MSPSQRVRFFTKLWPAACEAQGWNLRDETLRRDITAQCMDAIGCPGIESTTELKQAQITALFTFLAHLADPLHLGKSQQWTDCRADYVAFNLSRQADYWQHVAYGTGGHRITRGRFGRRRKAEQPAFTADPLTREEAEKRRLTMKSRAVKKRQYTLHTASKNPF